MNPKGITIPYVIEGTGREERHYDLFSRLLKDRIVFIGTVVDDTVSNIVIAQLLFLQMENPEKDINIYINSPGGGVTSGLAIYDTMQFVRPDVCTYCVGQATSMVNSWSEESLLMLQSAVGWPPSYDVVELST